jgi:Lar family restriction alleviation protein
MNDIDALLYQARKDSLLSLPVLVPCPFCGEPDPTLQDENIGSIWVSCDRCHAQGPMSHANVKDAADSWNRRSAI